MELLLETISEIGAAIMLAGAIMLVWRPTYAGAGVLAFGFLLAGQSILLAAIVFSGVAGLILLFGNPYRRRTSISTERPEGERTGSSPSNTP